jgi:hypothetical protein
MTVCLVGFSDKTQYKYFFRTIPTKITIADAMLDFVATQQWENIGVIYSNDLLGQHCKFVFLRLKWVNVNCLISLSKNLEPGRVP